MRRCACCLRLEEGDVETCAACGEASWEDVTEVSPVSKDLLDLQEVRASEKGEDLPKRRGRRVAQ